jgi:hypothetical protein
MRAGARRQAVDRRAVAIVGAFVIGVLVWLRYALSPGDPVAWTYQVLFLCLLLAAAAGRGLVGFSPPREEPEARRPRRGALLAALAICAAAIAPYLRSLDLGFFSDDFAFASAVKQINSPLELVGAHTFGLFYRPLTLLLWWAGDRLWAGAPLGFHVMNLALHAACSLLVFALGKRLTGSGRAALLAALLFALHPLHVEAVAWSCCFHDPLCAALSLLSLLLLEVHLSGGSAPGRRLALGGALAAFALALLAKEAALSLPGFVVLRLALLPGGRRRLLPIGAAYGAVLAGYVGLRLAVHAPFRMYAFPLGFWNTLFPSAALHQFGQFLLPIHRELLFGRLSPWLFFPVLGLMAAGLWWWAGGLAHVPGRRLWLWGGFVFVMALPVWTVTAGVPGNFEGSRYYYLPTIGLAWLFGDLAAGRGWGWRRSGAAALATLAAAGALCVWYMMPWREAADLRREILSDSARVVKELSGSTPNPVLFVTGLPDNHLGAQVFRHGFPFALAGFLGRPVSVQVVSRPGAPGGLRSGTGLEEALGAGEYLLAWRAKPPGMEVVGAGGPPSSGIREQEP